MKKIIAVISLFACISAYADVKKVKTEKELDDILKKNKTVVVKFGTTWCGHCKISAGPYKELSNEVQEVLVEVDGDESPALVQKYKISGYPTFIRFDNGKRATESGGWAGTERLKKDLKLTDKKGGVAAAAPAKKETVPQAPAKPAKMSSW